MSAVLSAVTVASRALMPVLFVGHGGGPCFFFDKTESPMFDGMDKVVLRLFV